MGVTSCVASSLCLGFMVDHCTVEHETLAKVLAAREHVVGGLVEEPGDAQQAHAAVEERRQRPAASQTTDTAPAAATIVFERPAPGKVIEPSTVKRAPKRPRTEGKDAGDLYAKSYQPPRHRSVLQS